MHAHITPHDAGNVLQAVIQQAIHDTVYPLRKQLHETTERLRRAEETLAVMRKPVSVQEAQALLGVSKPTVHKMITDGRLAAIDMPGTRRRFITIESIEALKRPLKIETV